MKQDVYDMSKWFFDSLGVETENIDVHIQDEERNIFMVTLKSDDSKLIIGPRGSTLAAIQTVLIQMVAKKLGTRCNIHVEVNDYLARKDEKLFRYIDRKIEYVMEHATHVRFRKFSSYERKKVHAYVSDKNIDGLETNSDNDEEGNRVLHLSYGGEPQSSAPTSSEPVVKMTIDIDGIDI